MDALVQVPVARETLNALQVTVVWACNETAPNANSESSARERPKFNIFNSSSIQGQPAMPHRPLEGAKQTTG
jgi:hypothetical protein